MEDNSMPKHQDKKMPKVSVIIPAYNEEKRIERGIRSSLTSTRTYLGECEIVVVDNASSDSTAAIVEAMMKEHSQIKLTKQLLRGISHARNKGASVATGEYLIFLDADSQIGPEFFANTITEMKKRNLKAAACCAHPDISTLSNRFLLNVLNITMVLLQNTPRPVGLGAAILAKKDLHDAIGGFDVDMYYGEDSEYLTKAKKHATFGVLEERFIFDMRRVYREGKIITVLKLLYAFGHHLVFGTTKRVKFRYDHDYH